MKRRRIVALLLAVVMLAMLPVNSYQAPCEDGEELAVTKKFTLSATMYDSDAKSVYDPIWWWVRIFYAAVTVTGYYRQGSDYYYAVTHTINVQTAYTYDYTWFCEGYNTNGQVYHHAYSHILNPGVTSFTYSTTPHVDVSALTHMEVGYYDGQGNLLGLFTLECEIGPCV